MLRNYLAAALRNLARNRLYAGISIFGLAVGVCATLLMGVVLRDQLTYDRFIPGYQNIFTPVSVARPTGLQPNYHPNSHYATGAILTRAFPEIEAITRIESREIVLHGDGMEAKEKMYWADPNLFDVLAFPAVGGDLKTALTRPDGVVLTRSIARKYFHNDDAIGQTLRFKTEQPAVEYPMTVTAIIEDLPENHTQFESGIFASALAPRSPFSTDERARSTTMRSSDPRAFFINVRTYFRLSRDASIQRLQNEMPQILAEYGPQMGQGGTYSMDFVRLDRLHLYEGLNPGIGSRVTISALVGVLILLIAAINFVNLSTARSAWRAREVGVRKASGAGKTTLILQFLGEAFLSVLLATAVAVTLTELLLPHVNALLMAEATFDYWRDPVLIASISLSLLLLSFLAGFYPAFVLSAFKPHVVLKGWIAHSPFAAALRRALVVLQFAILIGFVVAGGIVYQQRNYAMHDALRMNTDQTLLIKLTANDGSQRAACFSAFRTELEALPGVRGVSCTGGALFDGTAIMTLKNGTVIPVTPFPVDFNFFDLYGLKPVAGRIPPGGADAQAGALVINEMAVKRLGFESADTALGQVVKLPLGPREAQEPFANAEADFEIVGVAPDFSFKSVAYPIEAAVFYAYPRRLDSMHVKLVGENIPETLAEIDRLWNATGAEGPIDRIFLDDHIQNLYVSVLRQAQAFAIFSGLAVFLACLGLVGLAAATLQRRTKEIGIRKAMGANAPDIFLLLSWEFAKPVLWANLIAWPVAYYVMNRWLAGFAYHTDLELWVFLAAGAVALLIALATVSAHTLLVARAKPVVALRYE